VTWNDGPLPVHDGGRTDDSPPTGICDVRLVRTCGDPQTTPLGSRDARQYDARPRRGHQVSIGGREGDPVSPDPQNESSLERLGDAVPAVPLADETGWANDAPEFSGSCRDGVSGVVVHRRHGRPRGEVKTLRGRTCGRKSPWGGMATVDRARPHSLHDSRKVRRDAPVRAEPARIAEVTRQARRKGARSRRIAQRQ